MNNSQELHCPASKKEKLADVTITQQLPINPEAKSRGEEATKGNIYRSSPRKCETH